MLRLFLTFFLLVVPAASTLCFAQQSEPANEQKDPVTQESPAPSSPPSSAVSDEQRQKGREIRKECVAEWKAARAANTAGDKKRHDYIKECRKQKYQK